MPALILDPKGDMGNLALTFPDLAAASFEPWIDESTARDAGISVAEYAEQTATRWKEGLAASGIGPDRIQALRDAAEVTLYTPGSEAGVPLNVIGSLQAPTLSWDEDEETIRDEIEGTVTSLLGLVGIDADPLGSREHVLIANLLEHSWRAGKDLDLGSLISQIQTPPLRKLGVFEVDAFMPAEGAHRARDAPQRARRLAVLRRLGTRPGARPARAAPDRRRASRGPRSSTSPTSPTRSGSSS